jgi:hypothetical protein
LEPPDQGGRHPARMSRCAGPAPARMARSRVRKGGRDP